MAKKDPPVRYYIILFTNDEYKTHGVESIHLAHEYVKWYLHEQLQLPLSIYDPMDWSMEWLVSEDIKTEHFDIVHDLTFPLRWQ